jgi:hypothetical protein
MHVVRSFVGRVTTRIFTSQVSFSVYGMHLVAIAWIYVVLMMAIVEATSRTGTVLGALFTFLLYGVLPLSIVMYVMRTPQRRRRRLAEEAASGQPDASAPQPDRSDHATGDAVAAERKEP